MNTKLVVPSPNMYQATSKDSKNLHLNIAKHFLVRIDSKWEA